MDRPKLFRIYFDKGKTGYDAGDTLRGNVVLVLRKPLTVNSLTVNVYGKGRCRLSEDYNAYDHLAKEVYIDDVISLLPEKEGNKLPAGTYDLPFKVQLPYDIPASFANKHGYIKYCCKARLQRPWRRDILTETDFTIVDNLDLNQEPNKIKTPYEEEASTELSSCLFLKGEVQTKLYLEKQGFVPGESIKVTANVQNSSTAVAYTTAKLKQYVDCFGGLDRLGCALHNKVCSVISTTKLGPVAPGKTVQWDSLCLKVPEGCGVSGVPGCSIINRYFLLNFYTKLRFGPTMKMSVPITIGRVPLSSDKSQTGGGTYPCKCDKHSLPSTKSDLPILQASHQYLESISEEWNET